jgi:hypothetical protein
MRIVKLQYLPVIFFALLLGISSRAHAQSASKVVTFEGCTATLSVVGSGESVVVNASVNCDPSATVHLDVEACASEGCSFGDNADGAPFATAGTNGGGTATGGLTWSVNGVAAPEINVSLE